MQFMELKVKIDYDSVFPVGKEEPSEVMAVELCWWRCCWEQGEKRRVSFPPPPPLFPPAGIGNAGPRSLTCYYPIQAFGQTVEHLYCFTAERVVPLMRACCPRLHWSGYSVCGPGTALPFEI